MKLRIKSISDVITNSSSEVFVIKSDKKPNLDLKKYITEHCADNIWDNLYVFDKIPKGLRWLFTKDLITLIKENCNGTSGVGGDCEVYTWEDGYELYKRKQHKPKLTPEQWARDLGYSFEELKKIAVVDIDWACKATINMMEQEFTILDGDFFVDQFRY